MREPLAWEEVGIAALLFTGLLLGGYMLSLRSDSDVRHYPSTQRPVTEVQLEATDHVLRMIEADPILTGPNATCHLMIRHRFGLSGALRPHVASVVDAGSTITDYIRLDIPEPLGAFYAPGTDTIYLSPDATGSRAHEMAHAIHDQISDLAPQLEAAVTTAERHRILAWGEGVALVAAGNPVRTTTIRGWRSASRAVRYDLGHAWALDHAESQRAAFFLEEPSWGDLTGGHYLGEPVEVSGECHDALGPAAFALLTGDLNSPYRIRGDAAVGEGDRWTWMVRFQDRTSWEEFIWSGSGTWGLTGGMAIIAEYER